MAEELTRSELYEKSLGNGASLRIHEGITSTSICSRHCLAENWCHGFHHDSLNVMCHLYGSCIRLYGNKTIFSKASLDTTKNDLLAQGERLKLVEILLHVTLWSNIVGMANGIGCFIDDHINKSFLHNFSKLWNREIFLLMIF